MRWSQVAEAQTVADAARAYVALGLHPIALHGLRDGRCTCNRDDCTGPGKHPVAPGWQSAPLELPAIRPGRNVGLRTGLQRSGAHLLVVDVDGPLSLAVDLVGGPDGLVTLTSRTANGYHLLYRCDIDHPNRTRLVVRDGGQVDIRGNGGQIVAPPSEHHTGVRYAWSRIVPPARAPDALLDALLPARAPVPIVDRSARNADRYVEAAIRGEVDTVACAGTGGRNDALYRATLKLGSLAAGGAVAESEIVTELTAAALGAGLSESEIRKTIGSALRVARNNPREVAR